MKATHLGIGLAAIATLGLATPPAENRQNVAPPTVHTAEVQAKKKKARKTGWLPGTEKYSGAWLRDLRKKRAKEMLKRHYEICKALGVPHGIDEARIIDLHQ